MSYTLQRDSLQLSDDRSSEHDDAWSAIRGWRNDLDAPQIFRVTGPAGSGKSTLAARLMNSASGAALALAFAGKSASVLRRKGARRVSTIHSYLYGPPAVTLDRNGRDKLDWSLREYHDEASLLVVDEFSQIDDKLGRDLVERGIRIAAFGDSFQLPPVSGERTFFDRYPVDVELTEVHRQALNSQPLRMATRIREGGRLPRGEDLCLGDLCKFDVVLCALNRTRRRLNSQIRRRKFGVRTPLPIVGERIIARRNDHATGIYNGTIWSVEHVAERGELLVLELDDPDEGHRTVLAPKTCFTDGENVDIQKIPRAYVPLDFAYALTVHKSMGSEWGHVAVVDETDEPGFAYIARQSEISLDEFRRRWFYTGVSRASQCSVVVVG